MEIIRGEKWPVQGKPHEAKPAMGMVFGSAVVQRVFGDAPLFRELEGPLAVPTPTPVQYFGAAPGAELDGDGRRVVQSLLALDPATRGQAGELSKSNWFLERPVFQRTVSGRGGKGPFAVAEAYMGDDVLAPRS